MALPPESPMVSLVTVVAEVPWDSSFFKRKALNQPNRTQGSAHTATISATTQPRTLQQ